jgi:anthranilate phosphoribosyltransferase
MMSGTLERLLDARTLSPSETRTTFEALISSDTTDVERGAVLTALAGRPPSEPELARFAQEMRRRALRFPLAAGDRPVDLCGSGGARRPSFNVSTVSAFVVAAAGVSVVKHGNRSARGPCGSSDLLEALGLPVTSSIAFSRATYAAHRLAFLHAPLFHPETRAVGPVRKILGVPTIFNRLGPLTNPAQVPFQVVGMPDLNAARLAAGVLGRLGLRRGVAMTSADGCDEFSPRSETVLFLWDGRGIRRRELRPSELLPVEDRRGAWGPLVPGEAAAEAERLLAGGAGARRGSVLLTSAAALWVTGRSPSIAQGVDRARDALDSGRAEVLLHQLQEIARGFRTSEVG